MAAPSRSEGSGGIVWLGGSGAFFFGGDDDIDAAAALTAAISDAGQEIDDDIISKLTGKASVYFTGIINAIND